MKGNVIAGKAIQVNDWETEEDLRTLTRAVEIKKDPKRLKRAQELANMKGNVIAGKAIQVNDWETEEDLRTLTRAVEIKKDPKRLKRAQELAKKKLMEMASVAGGDDDGDAD